jgi:mRNA interferase RelE/StbE
MAWKIEIERSAERDIAKLGHEEGRRVLRFLHDRLGKLEDPRAIGEALTGSRLGEFWKYRVGDYRVIARIEDATLCILVVRIGNRKSVYR